MTKIANGGLIELIFSNKFEQKRHKVGKISFNTEAIGCTVSFDDLAYTDEVGTLLCIEERIGIVFYYVAELTLLFVFVFTALLQLLQFFYIHVLACSRHFALQVDPSTRQPRTFQLPIAYQLELLLHDCSWWWEHFVFFDNVLILGSVLSTRGNDKILVVVLPERKLKIVGGEMIPPIFAHELDGSLEKLSSFKFDEGLEMWIVLFFEIMLHSLRLNYMMYEIGVGK